MADINQYPGPPFKPGDIVITDFTGCQGHDFEVVRVHSTNGSFSRFMVVACLKGNKNREITGRIIDGINYGIDSSWFKLK